MVRVKCNGHMCQKHYEHYLTIDPKQYLSEDEFKSKIKTCKRKCRLFTIKCDCCSKKGVFLNINKKQKHIALCLDCQQKKMPVYNNYDLIFIKGFLKEKKDESSSNGSTLTKIKKKQFEFFNFFQSKLTTIKVIF